MSVVIIAKQTNVGPVSDQTPPNKVTSGAWTYYFDVIVQAICTNSAMTPSRPCDVNIELSTDGLAWVMVDKRRFSMGASITDYQIFKLADYAGSQSDFASGYGPPQAWLFFRVVMGGNQGSDCTVSAVAQ